MAGSLNKVMLIGNTGDDVKMHYFEGGACLGRFPVATSETYTNKTTGERVTNTEWHNIVVRNKGAEICEKYLKKGDKIYVEGRIKTRKWQDDQGNDRYSTEIQCTEFTFLSPKNENQSGMASQPQAASNPQSRTPEGNQVNEPVQQAPMAGTEDDNDDLPF